MDPNKKEIEFTWNAMQLKMFDPKTKASEQEVRNIAHRNTSDKIICSRNKCSCTTWNSSKDKEFNNKSIACGNRRRPLGLKYLKQIKSMRLNE